eukprot:CAMPEP_0177444308 /NCGR_PEP_ID=MMETSP0369-20130122/5923_1 /TAXON_ID=447022 ORGANISM="Scrippsiella hangoei-like, Strain SHHI-4" /NCGR_SAMPLE_ID=MMETSP0369 /ASSEMBLY_ACC=CAM_ASM_000364 /LENGTH=61 /DNA_ID=CAMNT_0018916341 /DNA_START=94 /DNA_END=279 /DNA_ORIENTATION=+
MGLAEAEGTKSEGDVDQVLRRELGTSGGKVPAQFSDEASVPEVQQTQTICRVRDPLCAELV